MTKFKAWVSAARLRTLPLSVSGIVVGSAIGHKHKIESLTGFFCCFGCPQFYLTGIFFFAILTTLGLQVLSNFANDYGDGVKGTDNEDRVGPMRAIQSGAISNAAMKRGIIITALLTLVFAVSQIGRAHV